MTDLNLPEPVQDFVIDEMTAPHRHYHTVAHLAIMMNKLYEAYKESWGPGEARYRRAKNEFALTGQDHLNCAVATIFHDVIYDPMAADNEERSAIEARLRLNPKEFDVQKISQLILATKDHDLNAASDPATYWMLYADLSILWSPAELMEMVSPRYRWYAHGVRKEYGHVPAEQYRVGRAAVLDKLHKSLTAHFKDCERAAWQRGHLDRNVRWELCELQNGTFDVP